MLSDPSNSISISKSLAFKAVFNRLPGSCSAGGVKCCHIGEDGGDIGGVEPSANGLIEPIEISIDTDFGDGIADPVEAYTGRSSSTRCAKKQTFLAHPISSLHKRVLYCAG